jgi:hypothetical protein
VRSKLFTAVRTQGVILRVVKKEVVSSSETSVVVCKSSRLHNPEDHNLRNKKVVANLILACLYGLICELHNTTCDSLQTGIFFYEGMKEVEQGPHS